MRRDKDSSCTWAQPSSVLAVKQSVIIFTYVSDYTCYPKSTFLFPSTFLDYLCLGNEHFMLLGRTAQGLQVQKRPSCVFSPTQLKLALTSTHQPDCVPHLPHGMALALGGRAQGLIESPFKTNARQGEPDMFKSQACCSHPNGVGLLLLAFEHFPVFCRSASLPSSLGDLFQNLCDLLFFSVTLMLVNAVKQCHHAAVKVINISQLACFSFLGSSLMIPPPCSAVIA